jgi:anthranilate phosphoribosyltransferase
MKNDILCHYIEEFRSDRGLTREDAEALFDALNSETDESLLRDLLTQWISKGHSEDELFALASVMRSRMRRIETPGEDLVDVVGTGGSRSKTFNVSTAAAFVVAGAGARVAKHGNRAATSTSGSADVLGLLGVKADVAPDWTADCLNEIGMCFMFAPLFHSLSPTLAKVRRELGKPTIFNNLGPLCNPAGAAFQLIGVWDHDVLGKTAGALSRLGTKRSWIVHGGSGLDEISLDHPTTVSEVDDSNVTRRTITSIEFGFIRNGGELPRNLSATESAALIIEIFENRQEGNAAEALVLINAAAAIYLVGKASDLLTALRMATESIRSGAAKGKLQAMREATNR